MSLIPCNQAYRLSIDGNLKKWMVARVPQKIGKRERSHKLATVLNMIQESNNLVFLEPEPGTTQKFAH